MTILLIVSIVPAAQAIVVRGTVTDPLGAAIVGARVQLIMGQKVAAFSITGPDGNYEIRSSEEGRFLLLTSAPTLYTRRQ